MRDLSVLIPARNERWLPNTVADVLSHAKADTEVIVVLDGAWPDEPLPQHERLTVVYLPESIGQRAATNLAARLSSARYVMKLDAHCSMADGFDVALIHAASELGDDVTQVPAQHNLHVFDWQCDGCGKRSYQGPTPTECDHCSSQKFHRELVWKPRRGVRTTSWMFDSDLKFQYWGAFTSRPEGQGDLTETMSCLGACWFISRERYWQIGGLDERHGSWGQMGTEIACKSWLSGGRLVCNQRTWFAHLFRTQGGDFGFPYPIKGSEQEAARVHSRELWLNDAWPGQSRPLSWLVEHFAPVPSWDRSAFLKTSKTPQTKGCVYYSDNRPEAELLGAVQRTIEASCLPIVAVTLQPMRWPSANGIVLERERGVLTMFEQILAGLEALDTDVAFLVEHDVLYHRSHFDMSPADARTYYYNQHVWKVDAESGRALFYYCNQTSGLCANRELLVNHYRARVAAVRARGFSRNNGFEPGTRQVRHGGFDDYGHDTWMSAQPNVDIRHGLNLTPSRWKKEQFRNQKYTAGWTEADAIPGWGRTLGRFREFLAECASASSLVHAA